MKSTSTLKSAAKTEYPIIHLVTPTFNSEKTIARTLQSVCSQFGDFFIRYLIQDGGSIDKTIEIATQFQRLMSGGIYPIHCLGIDIDIVSRKDRGMYDAIFMGINKLDPRAYDWLGWINSDDTIAEGAFASLAHIDKSYNKDLIQWVTGEVCVRDSKTGIQISEQLRSHPREVIAQGLCDGYHWDYIQQEGTFFRKRLWDKCEPNKWFREMKYAGDWNLWRRMAAHAELVKCNWPMGSFHSDPDQLSVKKKYLYELETVSCKSFKQRFYALQSIKMKNLSHTVSVGEYTTKELKVRNKNAIKQYEKWLIRSKEVHSCLQNSPSKHPYHEFDSYHYNSTLTVDASRPDIPFIKDYWQYPAITERYAAEMAHKYLPQSFQNIYFAFPWASLIDLINCNDIKRFALYDSLCEMKLDINTASQVFSVTQHVLVEKYLELFNFVGINSLFCSHTSNTLIKASSKYPKLKIRSFPLYPVQVAVYKRYFRDKYLDLITQPKEKSYLFSFVGAYQKDYLTTVRTYISEFLSHAPNSFVKVKSNWHFKEDVYGVQISTHVEPKSSKDSKKTFEDELNDYIQMLSTSSFVLCPSGSGVNTIRLWECIELNIVPVCLSDKFLPPGNHQLWTDAIIFAQETKESVKNLPQTLTGHLELIKNKQANIKALSHLYGSNLFISDIIHEWIHPIRRNNQPGLLEQDNVITTKRLGPESIASLIDSLIQIEKNSNNSELIQAVINNYRKLANLIDQ